MIEQSRVQSGGVNEGFEYAAGGALCHDMVELAHSVVFAADQRFHLAGMRVQADERHLRLIDRTTLGAFGEDRVDVRRL